MSQGESEVVLMATPTTKVGYCPLCGLNRLTHDGIGDFSCDGCRAVFTVILQAPYCAAPSLVTEPQKESYRNLAEQFATETAIGLLEERITSLENVVNGLVQPGLLLPSPKAK